MGMRRSASCATKSEEGELGAQEGSWVHRRGVGCETQSEEGRKVHGTKKLNFVGKGFVLYQENI